MEEEKEIVSQEIEKWQSKRTFKGVLFLCKGE